MDRNHIGHLMSQLRTRIDRTRAHHQDVIGRFDAKATKLTDPHGALNKQVDELDETAYPEGTPRQFLRVMERVDEGELDWKEVMTGRTTDVDAFAAHLWVRPRLEVSAHAGHLMRDGHAPETAWRIAREAYLEAERRER